MAKIIIEMDTVTKMATFKFDGKNLENVVEASLYQRYGDSMDPTMSDADDDKEYNLCLRQATTDKNNSVQYINVTLAEDRTFKDNRVKNASQEIQNLFKVK